jgi:hypothetical protein
MSSTEPAVEHPSFVDVVARNIRVETARKGVTLTAVADAIGLGQPALAKRMGGQVAWSLADVLAVARYFEVPITNITPDSLGKPKDD